MKRKLTKKMLQDIRLMADHYADKNCWNDTGLRFERIWEWANQQLGVDKVSPPMVEEPMKRTDPLKFVGMMPE